MWQVFSIVVAEIKRHGNAYLILPQSEVQAMVNHVKNKSTYWSPMPHAGDGVTSASINFSSYPPNVSSYPTNVKRNFSTICVALLASFSQNEISNISLTQPLCHTQTFGSSWIWLGKEIVLPLCAVPDHMIRLQLYRTHNMFLIIMSHQSSYHLISMRLNSESRRVFFMVVNDAIWLYLPTNMFILMGLECWPVTTQC